MTSIEAMRYLLTEREHGRTAWIRPVGWEHEALMLAGDPDYGVDAPLLLVPNAGRRVYYALLPQNILADWEIVDSSNP